MQLFCILTVLVNSNNANGGPELSAEIAKSASESLGKSKGLEVVDLFHRVHGFFNDFPSITFPHPKTGEGARPVCFPVPNLHKFSGMKFKLPVGFGTPDGGVPVLPPLPAEMSRLPDIFEDGSPVLEKAAEEIYRLLPEADPGSDFLGIGGLIKDTFRAEFDGKEDERRRAELKAMQAEAPQKTVPKTSPASQSMKAQPDGANGAAVASAPAELQKKSAEKAPEQKGAQPSRGAPPSEEAPAMPQEISAQKVPAKATSPPPASAVPETLKNVASSAASALPAAAPALPVPPPAAPALPIPPPAAPALPVPPPAAPALPPPVPV